MRGEKAENEMRGEREREGSGEVGGGCAVCAMDAAERMGGC